MELFHRVFDHTPEGENDRWAATCCKARESGEQPSICWNSVCPWLEVDVTRFLWNPYSTTDSTWKCSRNWHAGKNKCHSLPSLTWPSILITSSRTTECTRQPGFSCSLSNHMHKAEPYGAQEAQKQETVLLLQQLRSCSGRLPRMEEGCITSQTSWECDIIFQHYCA